MHLGSMGFSLSDRDGPSLARPPVDLGTTNPSGGSVGYSAADVYGRRTTHPSGGAVGSSAIDAPGARNDLRTASPSGDSAGPVVVDGHDFDGPSGDSVGAMIVSELNGKDEEGGEEGGDEDGTARLRGSGGRFVRTGPKMDAARSDSRDPDGPGGGSGHDGPPPSPTITVFATTGGGGWGGGGDLPPSTHANIKTILANQSAKAAACAILASVGGLFPQLRAAVQSKMGCGFLRAHIEDFPAVVLAEAAAELQSQQGAYGILRESARAAAAGAGEGGAFAAENLGSEFDGEAAAAILMGVVTVDLSPEEVVLGVLPLLSMALYVWFREHHPKTSAVTWVSPSVRSRPATGVSPSVCPRPA